MVSWLSPLDRKALRDLWHLRGQGLAISLVVASGVAVLVMALSTLETLRRTTDAYYERFHLADVFSPLKRAPNSILDRISEIPGVRTVEGRVVRYATVDIDGFNEPSMAAFVSIPDGRQPRLNQLTVRVGRWPRGSAEALLNEPFAEAHGLAPGSSFTAILNGHRRRLTVAGIALSPEFVYSLGPGALMPDDKRFGVAWMSREALAAAFGLKGSFNDVSVSLNPGANASNVIVQIDHLLEPYGGVGAVQREDQLSNWFVMNEIDQLAIMARILPGIFLLIAAFLTNMLLGRVLAIERAQIGLLKAFGYSNREVGVHYAKIVTGIALTGIVIGTIVGVLLGRWNTNLYNEVFRFPLLLYQPSTQAIGIAGIATAVAAFAGAAASVRKAVLLPPAQAMQPPNPPTFQRSRLSRSAFARAALDQPTRIIARNLTRWPGRSCLTTLGMAASVALLVLALQWNDSLHYLAQSYFFNAQRQHVVLGLNEAQGPGVLHNIKHLPGVVATEPMRIVSAEFSNGQHRHRGSIYGVVDHAVLQPIYDDRSGTVIDLPAADGLVIGRTLAEKLDLNVGDQVHAKLLEGRRPQLWLPIVALVDTHIGMPVFVRAHSLSAMLSDGPRVQYVSLLIDRSRESELYATLKGIPAVGSVTIRQAAIDSFYDTVVEHVMSFIWIFSGLACVMGFGVAYNSARITLSERGRELATLRVLGFSRGEISYILLGEVGFLASIALPTGCILGYWLSMFMVNAFNTEMFRIPFNISPATYGWAVIIAMSAALLSAFLVRARVDRLDLIEVLKSRE